MALRKRGKYRYGDDPADLRAEFERIGRLAEDVPTRFADARCGCGSDVFRLRSDDDAGAAIRTCVACAAEHPIADSDEFLPEAELVVHTCVCGGDAFQITVGVALYDESDDVRWLYLGCRCPACGLVGVYADWTCEGGQYRSLLGRV